MSYILDALKKSERERKKGQVPGLGTLQGLPGPGGRYEIDRLIWIYGLATILLLVALGVGIWLFMREPAPAPEEAPPVATAPPVAADQADSPDRQTGAARQGRNEITPSPDYPQGWPATDAPAADRWNRCPRAPENEGSGGRSATLITHTTPSD